MYIFFIYIIFYLIFKIAVKGLLLLVTSTCTDSSVIFSSLPFFFFPLLATFTELHTVQTNTTPALSFSWPLPLLHSPFLQVSTFSLLLRRSLDCNSLVCVILFYFYFILFLWFGNRWIASEAN